jgi:diguanylate cyclase (GGDEF)-like protein/PAS domain S-box-containing protein
MKLKGAAQLDREEWYSPSLTHIDEAGGIESLESYDVAGLVPDGTFDAITRLAADAFDAPIALVSFVDESREWVASAVGTQIREVALEVSLAARTICRADDITILDPASDTRYESNPLIASDRCRFYAGAPLVTPRGLVIGTLSVMDTKERTADVDARGRRMLGALASQLMAQLERHRERTELEERNLELHASQEDYRHTVELSPQMPWIADAKLNVLTPHSRWEELSGVSNDQAIGRGWLQRVYPNDLATVYEAMSSAVRTVTYDVKYRYRLEDGTYRWMRARAAPRYDEHGRIVRWYGSTEDVHDQEMARVALEESEAHYRWSVELSAQVQWTASPHGAIEMAGQRWQALTGQALEDVAGEGRTKPVHPDDIAPAFVIWRRSIETGQPYDAEYRVRMVDGSYRWFRAQAAARRDEHGEVVRWYGTLEDIHDRKVAVQALRESEERLRLATDAADMATWDYDVFTGEAIWNERFQDFVGVPATLALAPGGLATVVHPDDYLEVQARLDVLFTPGSSGEYSHEHRVVGADGFVRWVAARGRVHFSEGRPARFVGTLVDISAHKAAEKALRESEDHYRSSVELNPQIPWTAAPDGQIAEVGPHWRALTGVTAGARLSDTFHSEDVTAIRTAWRQAIHLGSPFDAEYRLRMRDGSFRWFRSRAAARRDPDGKIMRWYGTLEDIHDRKSAEQALRESEERFRLAAQAAGLGIWDYDAVTNTRIWSDQFKRMLGLSADAVAELELASRLVLPEDRPILDKLVAAAMAGNDDQPLEGTLRIRRANDGAIRWMRTSGWMTLGESGSLARLIVTVRDITEERIAEAKVRWTAAHDGLTQLPNRSSFQRQLEAAIQESTHHERRVALLMLDIDHFKQINDTLGHDTGDAVLCTFADRVRSALPVGDVVFRLGGDEFAVILQSVSDATEVREVAERILARLREPMLHEGCALDCKASIGASIYPDDASNPDKLLKDADIALYAAKAAGRSRLMMFQPELRAEMQRRASMLSIARDALDHDRIAPFYQPKVELSTGRISGFEALLRWRHPRLGVQAPGLIAAAFEDLDLANAMSDRIFNKVISDMRLWLDAGVDFGHVAVNASAAEFRHDDLAERILDRLSAASVPTSRLELEVTETVFLGRGGEYVDRALKLLAAEGVSIALDDFGTGYASLSHLKQFPVDIIKIDQSFVRDIESEADDAAIIKAVLNLGRSLGIKIVAEGIETPVQAAYLARLGCEYGQGFLFSEAIGADRIPNLVRERSVDRRWADLLEVDD